MVKTTVPMMILLIWVNNLIKFLDGEKYDFYGKSPNPDASLKDKKLLETIINNIFNDKLEFFDKNLL